MIVMPLQSIARQSFSIVLDNTLYALAVLETNGCMSLNIDRAGVRVLSGQRCVAGQLNIPYKIQEAMQGNFLFETANDDLPYYDQFGLTQTFIFASNAEIQAVRNGSD